MVNLRFKLKKYWFSLYWFLTPTPLGARIYIGKYLPPERVLAGLFYKNTKNIELVGTNDFTFDSLYDMIEHEFLHSILMKLFNYSDCCKLDYIHIYVGKRIIFLGLPK